MKLSLSFITTTTPVSALKRGAELATGGPHLLDPLGYSPRDHKIYLLEHFDDESGDLPQLHCIHTRGGHIGRMVPVHSWYQGAPEQVEAEFEDRLAELCRDLRPLTPNDNTTQLRLSTRVVRRRALRLYPGEPPIRKYVLRLTVRPTSDGRTATSIGAQTAVTAYLRPRARLTEVALVPGEKLALAVVTYTGLPYELGFDKSTALLVPLP